MATKIMVCDDSTIVRQQVSMALIEAGFEVLEAVDGQDASEKIDAARDVGLTKKEGVTRVKIVVTKPPRPNP